MTKGSCFHLEEKRMSFREGKETEKISWERQKRAQKVDQRGGN